jgi:hypothetical protein
MIEIGPNLEHAIEVAAVALAWAIVTWAFFK